MSFLRRFTKWRECHGFRVGVGLAAFMTTGGCKRAIHKLDSALGLIEQYDHRRFVRMRRELSTLRLDPFFGANTAFHKPTRECVIDSWYILRERTTPSLLATDLVGIATQGRIANCGITSAAGFGPRIGLAALRAELAFAQRLPHGQDLVAHAERMLAAPVAQPATEASTHDGMVRDFEARMRALGMSERSIRCAVWLATWRSRRKRGSAA
ncbi:MAG: hypothetical protein ACHP7P_14095 [Terriglobales bacterium]